MIDVDLYPGALLGKRSFKGQQILGCVLIGIME